MVLLHGDMDQFERNKVINAFKKQEIPILVATDVADEKQSSSIAMFVVTSPVVINAPTRGLLAVEAMHAIVQWLANLNIKRNMTSMFVNKKHRYSLSFCK